MCNLLLSQSPNFAMHSGNLWLYTGNSEKVKFWLNFGQGFWTLFSRKFLDHFCDSEREPLSVVKSEIKIYRKFRTKISGFRVEFTPKYIGIRKCYWNALPYFLFSILYGQIFIESLTCFLASYMVKNHISN